MTTNVGIAMLIILYIGVYFRKADHPKLYLWSKRWEDEEEITKAEEVKTESKPQDVSEKPQELPDMSLGQDKPCSQGSDETDIHPALKLPISQSELEHLASSVENKLRDTGEK